MITRTIEISTEGTHVSVKNSCLQISRDHEVVGSVPLEDLGLLVLDSHAATCTQAALTGVLEAGGTVLVCDGRHNPAGILLPIAGNQLHTEKLRSQVEAKKPLKKRIWRQLVL